MRITKLFLVTLLVTSIFPMLILLGCSGSTGKIKETIPTQWISKPVKSINIGKGTVNALEFAPNGKHLAVAGSEGLYIYDTNTGAPISLTGHEGAVLAVTWADNKTLASGGEDETVRLWDAKTGKLLNVLKGHKGRVNPLAFSPNGKTLANGYKWDFSKLKLVPYNWRKFEEETIKSLRKLDEMEISSEEREWLKKPQLDFLHESRKTWKANREAIIKTLPNRRSDLDILLWNASTGKRQRTLENAGSVDALTFVEDKRLASGNKDGGPQLWDVGTGSRINDISIGEDNSVDIVEPGGTYDGKFYKYGAVISPEFTAVVLSPDGTKLARAKVTVEEIGTSRTYKHINIILTSPDGPPHYINVKALVTAMAFSPKGTILASGSTDKTLRLWNAETGKPRQTLKGHTAGITALAFSKDGTLASGSDDGKVLLWGPNNQ